MANGNDRVWEVTVAARALNEKMLAVEEAGGFNFGVTLAYVHGIKYTGPNFKEEWEALREALAGLDG